MVIVALDAPPQGGRSADGATSLPPAQTDPRGSGWARSPSSGFVIGVAWPRLAGVRLGPERARWPRRLGGGRAPAAPAVPAPASRPPPAPAASPSPRPRRRAPRSAAPSRSVRARPRASPWRTAPCSRARPRAARSSRAATAARLPGLDGLVLPRLRKLADCPDAASTSGKLHLVVRADFARGRAHGRPRPRQGRFGAEPLLVCAKTAHRRRRASLASRTTTRATAWRTR